MKAFVMLAVAFTLGGCAITSSTGTLNFYPSREAPVFICEAFAYQYMPPFIYPPDDKVSKRAILYVQLGDVRIAKNVLNYKARLRASPRNLELSSSINRDALTITAYDQDTKQWWNLKFRRGPDGLFRLVSREGDFRD